MGTKPSRTRLASSSAEPRLTLYFLMLANMILPSQSVSQELLCPTASGDRPMQHSTMALIDAATAEGCLSAQSDRSGWHPTLGNIQRPHPYRPRRVSAPPPVPVGIVRRVSSC